MILYGAVILVILSIENEARTLRKSNTVTSGQKPDSSSIDTGELARLIHKINEAEFEEVTRLGRPFGIHLDYIGIRTSGEDSATKIVKTIQNKYGAINAKSGDGSGIRFHIIKNPHVLEQFKEDHMRKHVSTSSSSDVSSDYDELRSEKLIRRNAVFRLGSKRDSSENIYMRQNPKFGLRVAEENESPRQRNRKHSRENDRDYYGNDNIKEKIIVTFKDKPDEYDEMKKRFTNRHKENNEAAKTDWDMITNKNTDDWDRDKKTNKHINDYKNNDRNNYDKHRNDKDTQVKYKTETKDDWNKNKDDSWDNWKSKSMKKVETPREDKLADDDWGKPQKKKPVRDSNERKPMNDWNEKTEKKEDIFKLTTNKSNDWNRGSGSKKAYAPKIPDYYNPRPRIHDSLDRGGFKPFGRTSIPFVGKKGIYEEK